MGLKTGEMIVVNDVWPYCSLHGFSPYDQEYKCMLCIGKPL